MMNEQIMDIAEAILGEQPEVQPEPVHEAQPETVEQREVTTTPEVEETPVVQETVEEPEEQHVPLKALQEERRKRQEYEQKLKDLEEKAAPKEPSTVQEMFDKDPQGTLEQINATIETLASEDPYANAGKIEKLRDLKVELRERGQQRVQTEQTRFMNDLNTAVPDFPKKVQALTDFALNDMGYSMETINQLSNPGLVGPRSALEFIKSVAKQYEAKQATTTVKQKIVQPKPTTVEQPGSGAKQTGESLEALKQEAYRTGNFTKFLAASGVIPD